MLTWIAPFSLRRSYLLTEGIRIGIIQYSSIYAADKKGQSCLESKYGWDFHLRYQTFASQARLKTSYKLLIFRSQELSLDVLENSDQSSLLLPVLTSSSSAFEILPLEEV